MTGPASPLPKQRIVALFSGLLGIGGIQEAGRLTAAALDEISFRHKCDLRLLSLNDPLGQQSIDTPNDKIVFQGFGRQKVRFVLSAICSSSPFTRRNSVIVLAAHPHLAVPARWMHQTLSQPRTVVMSHGVEVWELLASARQRALVQANLVLAPSKFTAQKLIDVQGVRPERVRRLPWPLDPQFLEMAGSAVNLILPPGFPQGRIVLSVGRWSAAERYKGTDNLIRAVPSLCTAFPNLQLVAIGGGDDLPRLKALAADLGVGNRVHFLENISRAALAACYARAELFALPSTGEGFGLVFLEAMAFAKPVVGAACGGITDIVENEVSGLLVPPHDSAALALALSRLLGSESLRQQMGQRGAEIVRQKYSFGTFQRNLEQVLLELVPDSAASQ